MKEIAVEGGVTDSSPPIGPEILGLSLGSLLLITLLSITVVVQCIVIFKTKKSLLKTQRLSKKDPPVRYTSSQQSIHVEPNEAYQCPVIEN